MPFPVRSPIMSLLLQWTKGEADLRLCPCCYIWHRKTSNGAGKLYQTKLNNMKFPAYELYRPYEEPDKYKTSTQKKAEGVLKEVEEMKGKETREFESEIDVEKITSELERLLREGADKNGVARGLAGVGTQESMEMRERLLREGANKDYVAWGLAGVGTQEAYEFRSRHLTDPTIQARSFSAGSLVIEGVVCRYGYEQ